MCTLYVHVHKIIAVGHLQQRGVGDHRIVELCRSWDNDESGHGPCNKVVARP